MSLFHRHNWNLIDKTERESMIEQAKRLDAEFNIHPSAPQGTLERAMHKPLILTFKCDCGKVKVEQL